MQREAVIQQIKALNVDTWIGDGRVSQRECIRGHSNNSQLDSPSAYCRVQADGSIYWNPRLPDSPRKCSLDRLDSQRDRNGRLFRVHFCSFFSCEKAKWKTKHWRVPAANQNVFGQFSAHNEARIETLLTIGQKRAYWTYSPAVNWFLVESL